jgi:lysozyme
MKNSTKAGAAGAGAIMLACTFIAPWEGLWTTAKVDTIGTGRPVTWCYGETKGNVKPGQKFTPQQCSDMLAKRLPEYNAEISKCISVPISDKARAAFISFAYNVGSGAFCKGEISKKLNSGDAFGACDAMLVYDHAQGRKVRGLTNRRNAERDLCIEGITETNAQIKQKPVSFLTKLHNFLKGLFHALH